MDHSERLHILDGEIDESIRRTQNAKTGEEIKISIIEFERLMLTREKIFTEYVMGQRADKKKERNDTEMTGYRYEKTVEKDGHLVCKRAFPTGTTQEEREKRYVTENEFMQQMIAESQRCTDAVISARTALIWNAVNTVLVIAVAVAAVLFH